VIKTCYNNGQKERLCLIIDKCRRQKLCKRAQKISAAAPLRVMAIKPNFVEDHPMIIPVQLGLNCPCGFREEAF
jgi:hypothetical protein